MLAVSILLGLSGLGIRLLRRGGRGRGGRRGLVEQRGEGVSASGGVRGGLVGGGGLGGGCGRGGLVEEGLDLVVESRALVVVVEPDAADLVLE